MLRVEHSRSPNPPQGALRAEGSWGHRRTWLPQPRATSSSSTPSRARSTSRQLQLNRRALGTGSGSEAELPPDARECLGSLLSTAGRENRLAGLGEGGSRHQGVPHPRAQVEVGDHLTRLSSSTCPHDTHLPRASPSARCANPCWGLSPPGPHCTFIPSVVKGLACSTRSINLHQRLCHGTRIPEEQEAPGAPPGPRLPGYQDHRH